LSSPMICRRPRVKREDKTIREPREVAFVMKSHCHHRLPTPTTNRPFAQSLVFMGQSRSRQWSPPSACPSRRMTVLPRVRHTRVCALQRKARVGGGGVCGAGHAVRRGKVTNHPPHDRRQEVVQWQVAGAPCLRPRQRRCSLRAIHMVLNQREPGRPRGRPLKNMSSRRDRNACARHAF